jgi:hypothetical protein
VEATMPTRGGLRKEAVAAWGAGDVRTTSGSGIGG